MRGFKKNLSFKKKYGIITFMEQKRKNKLLSETSYRALGALGGVEVALRPVSLTKGVFNFHIKLCFKLVAFCLRFRVSGVC